MLDASDLVDPAYYESINGEPTSQEPPWSERLSVLLTVVGPLTGVAIAIRVAWGVGIGPAEIGVSLVMYGITAIGVSLGFHRLFTHKSFETRPAARILLAIAGSMANQGPLFEWVAFHRIHHQRADRAGDPHSPFKYGQTMWNIFRGFWHAHVGWLFEPNPKNLDQFVPDLVAESSLVRIDRSYYWWVMFGLFLPAFVNWAVQGTLHSFLLGFLWGGLVRLFLLHHVTWSINSVCHLWGTRPYRTPDMSTNNLLLAFLGVGEGWHNNHHAFPSSPRHGLEWWEFDFSFLFLLCLQAVGLAWNLKIPSKAQRDAKSVQSGKTNIVGNGH
jgi:stearoyl-CoA desaturase (delta-9 desaturase)